MAAKPMQVVCVMSLTATNTKDQKGSGAADIVVRKKAYEDIKKACAWLVYIVLCTVIPYDLSCILFLFPV
jgi:hypothetical protein